MALWEEFDGERGVEPIPIELDRALAEIRIAKELGMPADRVRTVSHDLRNAALVLIEWEHQEHEKHRKRMSKKTKPTAPQRGR